MNYDNVEEIHMRMSDNRIEVFKGEGCKGILSLFKIDGTWTRKAIHIGDNGKLIKVLYPDHIVSIDFKY